MPPKLGSAEWVMNRVEVAVGGFGGGKFTELGSDLGGNAEYLRKPKLNICKQIDLASKNPFQEAYLGG